MNRIKRGFQDAIVVAILLASLIMIFAARIVFWIVVFLIYVLSEIKTAVLKIKKRFWKEGS